MDIVTTMAHLSGVPWLGAAVNSGETEAGFHTPTSVNGTNHVSAMVLYHSVDNLRICREQCRNLSRNSLSLLAALQDQTPQNHAPSPAVSDAVSELENALYQANKEMEKWIQMGAVEAFVHKDKIRDQLQKMEKRVETVAKRFSMRMDMENHEQLTMQRQFAESFAESVNRDLANISNTLREIISQPRTLSTIESLQTPAVQTIMESVQEQLLQDEPQPEPEPERLARRVTLNKGLAEIKRRTGILPPLTDLTGQITNKSLEPFESGLTADIYLGEWVGEKVALKKLRNIGRLDEVTERHVQREIHIWRDLKHPNVLRFYGVCYIEQYLHLVSPYAVNHNAEQYLRSDPKVDRVKIFLGLQLDLPTYIHNSLRSFMVCTHETLNGCTLICVAGDLRAANILINERGEAQVSDFGLSRLEEVSDNATSTSLNTAGACRWMAPEIIEPRLVLASQPVFTKKTDVWSCGCVGYEFFSGHRPYDHRKLDAHVIMDITNQWRHSRPWGTRESYGLTDELWTWIKRCWDQLPDTRPDMATLHAAVKEIYESSTSQRVRSWSQSTSPGDRSPDAFIPGSSPGSRSRDSSDVPLKLNGYSRTSPKLLSPNLGRFYSHSPKSLPKTLEVEETQTDAPFEWFGDVVAQMDFEDEVIKELQDPFSKIRIQTSTPNLDNPPSRSNIQPGSLAGSLSPRSSYSSLGRTPQTASFPLSSSSTQMTFSSRGEHSQPRPSPSDPQPPPFGLSRPPPTKRPHSRRPDTMASVAPSLTSLRTHDSEHSSGHIDFADIETSGPFEVRLSPDGKAVEAGTMEGLVRLMVTSSGTAYRQFRKCFLGTYRAFAPDNQLFVLLMEEYRSAGNLPTREKVDKRYYVIDTLKNWCEHQDGPPIMPSVLRDLDGFLQNVREPETLRSSSMKILDLLDAQASLPNLSRRRQGSSANHSVYSPSTTVRISSLSALDIAEHLTIMESRIYSEITLFDCLAKTERLPLRRQDAITRAIQRHEQISTWVETITLQSGNQSALLARWISIASECRRLQNFSSTIAIVLALQRTRIQNLTSSWKKVEPSAKDVLASLLTLVDHNMRKYREAVREADGPIVPVVAIHYHDLILPLATKDPVVAGSSGPLINFSRLGTLHAGVPRLLQYQRHPYSLVVTPDYLLCVEGQVKSMELSKETEKQLDKQAKLQAAKAKAEAAAFKVQKDILGW